MGKMLVFYFADFFANISNCSKIKNSVI